MSGAFFSGPLAQAVGWSLLHLVWEATLVAGILAAVLALMTRRSANARYLVSCGALALLPLLALATAARSYESSSSGGQAPAPVRTGEAPVLHQTPVSDFLVAPDQSTTLQTLAAAARGRMPQIVLLWLAGVTFFSIRLVVSWTRVQRLARNAAKPATASWQHAAARLADALGLRRAIALMESAAVEVPTVIGWLRPMILLPASALSGLTAEQLEMVLAHELAHIRRNDFLINLMQTVVETLMFYHPAMWWISNRIRDEREHCCDDLAVAVCGNPLQYARALTRLEELRAARTELAVAANGGSLMMRIRRLVVSQKESTGGGARWAAGAAVLAVVIALFTLPTLPALANHDGEAKEQAAKTAKSKSPAPAKTEIDVHAEEAENADVDVNVDVDSNSNDGSEQPAPPATPAVAAPSAAPAPQVTPEPSVTPMPPAVIAPRVHVTIAPEAMAMAEAAAPHSLLRHRDGRVFGENGKLTVDELIALRSCGVTADYINDMRANSGFSDLSLHDLYEMRAQGVTPKYLRDLRNSGIPVKTAHEAVELRAMGVTGDYAAEMARSGFKNLSVRELVELRSQGVTPDYISELAAAGYKNLSVHDIVSLRAMGVSTSFIRALADAGYSNLSASDLTRLAASGVNADFIREMSQYRKK